MEKELGHGAEPFVASDEKQRQNGPPVPVPNFISGWEPELAGNGACAV